VIKKMKSIFLSVIVISALAIAGIGGTLAGFSDTESIEKNKIEMGSIDLKVNGTDDLPWGEGLSGLISLTKLNPGEEYRTAVKVQNAGDKDGYLYIHFKNMNCYNIETHEEWWIEEEGTGKMKPEPEIVAEYGGKVNCCTVPGLGVSGDDCSMGSHVKVAIDFDGKWVIGTPEKPINLGSLNCSTYAIGELPLCGEVHEVSFYVIVPQVADPLWPRCAAGALEPEELKYWPTNRIMADGISFDIELLLFDKPLKDGY
jgi:predicted ribosomally synthesized peptide with SipW-like signal peptide